MKTKLYIITKANCGEILPNSWVSTKWIIYDDLSVEIIKEYNREDGIVNSNKTINDNKLNIIRNNINIIKKSNNIVNVYDGDTWTFEEYNNNDLVWTREQSYIYGIKELEELSNILEK